MAITAASRGSASSSSAGTTLLLYPSSNCVAGDGALLSISADNSALNGASNNIDSVSDSLGNVWSKRTSLLYDPGAANAGVQGAYFSTDMAAGTITTSTAITITFGDSTAAKVAHLYSIAPDPGHKIQYVSSQVGAGGNSNSQGASSDSVATDEIVFCTTFYEYGNPTVSVQDSDTTCGSWSAATTVQIGTGATGIGLYQRYKVATCTSVQAMSVTFLTSFDYVPGSIQFNQVPLGAGKILEGKTNSSLLFGRVVYT